jgi:hypothetical protein
LIRYIVLSRTYRQSSDVTPATQAAAAADPDNVLLWRMSPRRLEAEMLRDAVLAVSGTLRPCAGGPALAPEFRENVGGLNPKDVNPISFTLQKFRYDQAFLRTIYLPVVRSSDQQGPGDVLNFFDFTQPALMTGTRTTTAVSSQALFLLNGPLLKDAAKKLAEELRTATDLTTDADRIQSLWRRVLNRPVLPDEESAAAAFLTSVAEGPDLAWQQLTHALLVSNEFLFRL